MKLVPLKDVKPNSYLAKTIYDSEGRVLLNCGAQLNKNIIQKLMKYQIAHIYITENNYAPKIKLTIKKELHNKCLSTLKNTFNDFQKNSSPTLENDSLKSIILLAEELLETVLSNDDIVYFLSNIKNAIPDIYEHSLNITVISLVVGIGLRLSKNDLLNLCIGALLHDIGKSFIDKDLINKDSPLTQQEYEILKEHCEKGYNYLKDMDILSSDSKAIILQHHERIDGSGYPKGLVGNQINYLARIVAISDAYDALTSEKNYMSSLSASDALEYIMSNAGTLFDFGIVKIFSKVIVPFPNGTIVKLSTGDIGMVTETLRNFPLRPKVKIIKSNKSEREGTVINLIDNLSIVISETYKNNIGL
ncbi:HD-GYP domain-containing protein [Caproiciproducens sp. MSJ-32]|uniref:HD-GYP domain-containing protein n=1 Tax=Caproiciproducens sp. MSJ-32 TaxID=2841527 RepID=UPI001C1259D8|nr:HD-GYP domain-containing protein [Caproiciproducens sp. MSJ-32]MBU5453951.1 HD-GYP domain-containing protein [Caproiciproducens sp. MSJ-32]